MLSWEGKASVKAACGPFNRKTKVTSELTARLRQLTIESNSIHHGKTGLL
jgi:hypothetical protein